MASIQKKGESWYCQFVYQGRRHTLTVGKVEEDEATTTAARVDYILMRIRQRLLQVPTGMDIVKFIEHDGKPPAAAGTAEATRTSTPFSEFREAYLRTFANGAWERNTFNTAAMHLRHLAKSLGEKFPMDQLALPDLQRHIDRRQKKITAVTIKKEIDTLRAAWNWACRMKLTQGPFPNAGLVYPKSDEKLPFMTRAEIERRVATGGSPDELWECLYLTHNEVAELLDHVQKQSIRSWVYPAFVFTAHTGARRSEMMRARTEDVNLGEAIVTIREKKRVKGRRTTRRVPLSRRLIEALTAWMPDRQAVAILFGHEAGTLSPKAAQVGFDQAVRGSKWIVLRGWHVLRHSFISALATQGVDQRLIDDFVGHQTEEQRRRYRHLYPSTQHQAIRKVFDRT